MEPGARDARRAVVTRIVGLSRPDRARALERHFPADAPAQHHLLKLLDLYDALHVETDVVGEALSVVSAATPSTVAGEPLPEPAALLKTGESYGPYEVIRPLAAGGMGQVFLARDTRLGRRVALKSLAGRWLAAPTARKRLMREAEAAGALVHPNIATLFDVLEVEPHLLLVMEYVEGRTVQELLREGALPLASALRIACQVARAIAFAHDHHVIHCDIKPGNIQVCPGGDAKVLDFGLARVMCSGDAGIDASITSTGRILCTPGYVAPERILTGVPNASGDIYSIGVVLFEMVTGRRLFDPSHTVDEWLDAINGLAAKPTRLTPDLPPALDDVIARAIAEPSKRYQSAHDLANDVEDVLDALQGRTPPVRGVTPISRPRAASGYGAVLHAVATAAAATALFLVAGLITTGTFNLGLGRPAEFDPEPGFMFVFWGARSLIGPAVLAVVALIAIGIGTAAGGLALKVLSSVTQRPHLTSSRWTSRAMGPVVVARQMVTAAGAPAVLIAEAVALVVLVSSFAPTLDGVVQFTLSDRPGPPSDLSALGPDHVATHRRFRQCFSAQLLIFAFAWFQILALRRRRGAQDGRLVVAGGLALTLFSFLFLVAPYRTLLHNRAERVMLGSDTCYLVGQNGDDGLLFCGSQTPRARVVRLSDPQLKRDGTRESIFTEVQ